MSLPRTADSGVQLLDSVLRFRFERRIRFHRHAEFMVEVYGLTNINSCRPLRHLLQHAFCFVATAAFTA